MLLLSTMQRGVKHSCLLLLLSFIHLTDAWQKISYGARYGWLSQIGSYHSAKLAASSSLPPSSLSTLGTFQLLSLPHRVLTEDKLRQLNPVQLAFIGDAVYELYARTLYVWPPKKAQAQRSAAVEMVRAESQSRLLRRLLACSWQITPFERGLLRKGRNAAGRGPARLASGAYGEASGFETLLGYLYLTDRTRLEELLFVCSDLQDPSPRPEDEQCIDWNIGASEIELEDIETSNE
jgi:ribonuclease-3 family protein